MKKILLTITAFASSAACIMAQGPDFGFETWNNVFGSSTIQDPQGWASLNTLASFGGSQSVFKETTAPAAGATSAQITTVKVTGALIPNPYQPGTNLDTAGLLAIGAIILSPPGITYGYNFSMRPTTLSFQSKYTPVSGDSAFVLAYLTKYNGSSRDTVAWGKYATGASSTSYASNNVTMTYDPAFASVTPDSQQVFISSSIYSHDGAKVGSSFYIDALAWSGWNAVEEISGVSANVTVFPNPATTSISFESSADIASVEVTDVTGYFVGTYAGTNNKANIQTTGYAPGLYIYTVYNTKKAAINRGRFQIAK
jgi:hypothetical protein